MAGVEERQWQRKRRRCNTLAMLTPLLVLGFFQTVSCGDFGSQDDRCYLSNGGSSETFTVREDIAVESIVGTLPIPGDPSETGDIELTLESEGNPVSIQPGTKNLVLKKALDKEGVTGASSVLLNVICSRKGSTADNDEPSLSERAVQSFSETFASKSKDIWLCYTRHPSITIPVRIIIRDANDNTPLFVSAPYFANISEVTVIGSTVVHGIKAIDKDQYGPFSTVEYHVIPGPYSHLLSFENRLKGNLVLTEALDYESFSNFSVVIRAQDQGNPPLSSETTLTIQVLDADDQNPKFLYDRYTATLPENPRPGTRLITEPEAIQAVDPDIGIRAQIQYSFNSDSREYSYFQVNPETAEISISKALPEKELRLPLTLVLKATQMDNSDRYSLTTLTVEMEGAALPEGLKFLQSEYVATVLESAPVGQAVTTVHITKPGDKHARLQVLENSSEQFAVRNSGEIIVAKPLDYEKKIHYTIRIVVSDGKTSDVARVNVTVMNVNDHDPRFSRSQYNFLVPPENVRIGGLVGTVEVTDGDVNDTIELSVKGPFARIFSVSHSGELRIRSLEFLNASTCHVILVARDDGVPPRQSSVPVTVQFPEETIASVRNPGVLQRKAGGVGDGSLVLMIVFGVLLGTLLVVIVTLTVYILKTKHYREHRAAATSLSNTAANKMVYVTGTNTSPSKPPGPNGNTGQRNGVENPVFSMTDHNQLNHQVNQQRNPAPPAPPAEVTAWKLNNNGTPALAPKPKDKVLDSPPTQNGNAGKIQNVYWPNGSIPRRVKKLSWEDEQPNRTELDPDVSVTPLGKTSSESPKHPGLTVYF